MESVEGEDWNVDDCRGDHESDEHWELRRQFIVSNKGRFPKLRIICLSQVFANMEFLGCKYPMETMELVAELSTGIIEDYRKNQQGRLQRTFVKASDAAERKTKGTKRPSNSNPNPSPQPENKHFKSDSFPRSSLANSFIPSSTTSFRLVANGQTRQSYLDALKEYGNDLKGLVLVEQLYVTNDGPLQILNRSCAMSHKNFSFKFDALDSGMTKCSFHLGNTLIAHATTSSKDSAKLIAAELSLNKLKKVCYTIQMKAMIVSNNTEVSKDDLSGIDPNHAELKEDNIGSKLLKLMGWTGGGLGKDAQGIAQPIKAHNVVGRQKLGLGLTHDGDLTGTIRKFLESQMWQCAQFDLQFSPEFNQTERKVIHQVASQLGLKSRSYGKDDNRFLVISRKIQLEELLQEILQTGETAKYRVIEPTLLKNCPTANGTPAEDSS